MKALRMTITATEPLVITSGSAESMAHECLGYIPGNMLLGALACHWKKLHPGETPDDSPVFRRLFLDGGISWGHALPLCENEASVPVPLSYKRVKNHSALPGEYEDFNKNEYGVLNLMAIRQDDPEALQHVWNRHRRDEEEKTGERIKTKKMPQAFMNPQTLHLAPERRVWNIHVALGKSRSALPEQLFGYSALEKGSKFSALAFCRSEEDAAALSDLIKDLDSLAVGHARSAGYGHADISCQWKELDFPESEKKSEHTLFMLSQYLPFPAWENPLKNLAASLEALVGQKPKIEANFSAFQEIQGYNGFWNRPRNSRLGLVQGSVLRVEFDNPVSLAAQIRLGAGQLEGYGRILVNPAFLEQDWPVIAPPVAIPAEKAKAPAAPAGPVWTLLRERALDRLAQEQMRQWLYDDRWRKFLDDVSRKPRPTASQRNNLRDISLDDFKAMLEKTPGDQWNIPVYCPFRNEAGSNSRKSDHLKEVIKQLLDAGKFAKSYPVDRKLLDLPGLAPTDREIAAFGAAARRLFVRELISLWNKMSQKSGDR